MKMTSYVAMTRNANNIEDKRNAYIKYFTHMQQENNKSELSQIAFHWVQSAAYDAINKDECITKEELVNIFPDLLGYLND